MLVGFWLRVLSVRPLLTDVPTDVVLQTNPADEPVKAADAGKILYANKASAVDPESAAPPFNLSCPLAARHQKDPDFCMNISAAGKHRGSHLLPKALNAQTFR